jgi:hypothetical protein
MGIQKARVIFGPVLRILRSALERHTQMPNIVMQPVLRLEFVLFLLWVQWVDLSAVRSESAEPTRTVERAVKNGALSVAVGAPRHFQGCARCASLANQPV